MFDKRLIVIPLARMKDEDGDLVVPYSLDHIKATPEIDGDEIDEADDRRLRDHYSIDAGDQELRDDNLSYATLVPTRGAPRNGWRTPPRWRRRTLTSAPMRPTSGSRIAGPAETRDVDAGEIANELTTNQANSDEGAGEGGDSARRGERRGGRRGHARVALRRRAGRRGRRQARAQRRLAVRPPAARGAPRPPARARRGSTPAPGAAPAHAAGHRRRTPHRPPRSAARGR